jgi:hypothetical protein
MGLVVGLIVSGALLGVVVAVLERSSFPGWGPMIGSAFAIGLLTALAGVGLPERLWPLQFVVGGIAGAFVLEWVCAMTFRNALLAVGIYVALRTVFALVVGV